MIDLGSPGGVITCRHCGHRQEFHAYYFPEGARCEKCGHLLNRRR